MCNNIEARFPQKTCKILESLGFFDIKWLPMSSSLSFCVYGKNEISFFVEQFFPEKSVEIILTDWGEFRFELIDIKKKYQLLIENLTNNNLKLKETASGWPLQCIVKGFRDPAWKVSKYGVISGSYFSTFGLNTAWKVSKYGVIFGPYFPAFGLNTAWKVSKYGVISGPYFPAFGLNTAWKVSKYEVISGPYLRENADQKKLRIRTLFTQWEDNYI